MQRPIPIKDLDAHDHASAFMKDLDLRNVISFATLVGDGDEWVEYLKRDERSGADHRVSATVSRINEKLMRRWFRG